MRPRGSWPVVDTRQRIRSVPGREDAAGEVKSRTTKTQSPAAERIEPTRLAASACLPSAERPSKCACVTMHWNDSRSGQVDRRQGENQPQRRGLALRDCLAVTGGRSSVRRRRGSLADIPDGNDERGIPGDHVGANFGPSAAVPMSFAGAACSCKGHPQTPKPIPPSGLEPDGWFFYF